MNTNPLKEIQDVKDQLAKEANYDINVFIEQLKAWTKANPLPGRRVKDVAEWERIRREEAERAAVVE